MFRRYSKVIAAVVVCFFTWTSGGVFSLAHAAQQEAEKPKAAPQKKKAASVEERFAKITEDLENTLADGKADHGRKKSRLKAGRDEINKLDGEMRSQFAATEQKLKAAKLPAAILERHHKFVKHYDDNLNELKGNIARVENAKNQAEIEVEVEKTHKHLKRVKAPFNHQKLDPNNLHYGKPKVIKREPRMKKEDFDRDLKKDKQAWKSQKRIMVASAGSLAGLLTSGSVNAITLPSADELLETPDVQFTSEIRAKALELENNPVKIYDWVRNNIEFIPTWGSVQGAHMTLLSQQGNAFDIASLLIALLRVSGFSAHYVSGTIELPIDKAKKWAGGFTDSQATGDYFASGGTPGKSIIENGVITKVQLEHVWVEAFLPYGNYRGTMRDQSNPMWVPLDGSFKFYDFTAPFDVTAAVPFNQDVYLSSLDNTMSPQHFYQAKIQDYFDTSLPDRSFIEAKATKQIKATPFNFLPSSLPYKTVAILNKASSIAASAHNGITLTLTSENNTTISYAATTAELAGKRVTLSYRPATPEDEALVATYGGIMYNVPAYLLQVKPELMVDGSIVLTGEPSTIGTMQKLMLNLQRLGVEHESTDKTLIVGGYYEIGLNLAGYNSGNMGNRNGAFLNKMATLPPEAFTNDDLIGEHLHQLAMAYFFINDTLYGSAAKLYNIAQFRQLSGCFVSITPNVTYVNGIPQTITLSGIEMDMRLERMTAVARDGNLQTEKKYMELAGLISSFDEHYTFEAIEGVASVSAVKALQFANQNGITVYKITQANQGQYLPLLQIGQKDLTDITNALNSGKEVIVSQTNVQINDWNGLGYIVRDSASGSGAYIISGGLAGAASVDKMNKYNQLYEGPYAGIKNTLDLQTQNTIVTAASAEDGEDDMSEEKIENVIVNGAKKFDKWSYEKVGRCTGLVVKAYNVAGIDLVEIAKKYGTGNPNYAPNLYKLISKVGLYRSPRTDNSPILGDIIFWNYTYDRNNTCNLSDDEQPTHVGVVSTVNVDGNGTVKFVHASSKGVSVDNNMNVSSPSTPSQNTSLRGYPKNGCPNDGNSIGKRSGELFKAFGTIR